MSHLSCPPFFDGLLGYFDEYPNSPVGRDRHSFKSTIVLSYLINKKRQNKKPPAKADGLKEKLYFLIIIFCKLTFELQVGEVPLTKHFIRCNRNGVRKV